MEQTNIKTAPAEKPNETIEGRPIAIHRQSGFDNLEFNSLKNGIIFQDGELWGLKSRDNVVILAPNYSVIAKTDNKMLLILPSGNYKVSTQHSSESGWLSPEERPFMDNGKVGFKANGAVIIPPVYDYIETISQDLFVAEKDGDFDYYDSTGRKILTDIRRFEGEDKTESPVWLCTNDFDYFTTIKYLSHPAPENNNALKSGDNWVELERYDKDEILSMLIDPTDDLALTRRSLSLLTNKFSYEYCIHFAGSNGKEPLHDCLEQLEAMNTFNNSWYYVVKIWQAPGEHLAASELRYFRNKLKRKLQIGDLTIAIGHDANLKPSEVRMLFITHYHERCWPAHFEYEWENKIENLSICELKEATNQLKKDVKECYDKGVWDEVYQDQLLCVFDEMEYHANVSWDDAETALNFFMAEGSPIKTALISSLQKCLQHIKHNEKDAAVYFLKVAGWALKNGSKTNITSEGKSALDLVHSIKSSENCTGTASDEVSILEKSLNKMGAKTGNQLRSEETSNKDYFRELEYMRLDDCSDKAMPSLTIIR